MVITCKYFSGDFLFDLCHDFSFWRAETGRCIPKEMYDDEYGYYSFPPLCNRTEFNCMSEALDYFHQYCPNKDKSCEYEVEQHFFCNESKTCIPNGNFITLKILPHQKTQIAVHISRYRVYQLQGFYLWWNLLKG